jgi:hypothetical protein
MNPKENAMPNTITIIPADTHTDTKLAAAAIESVVIAHQPGAEDDYPWFITVNGEQGGNVLEVELSGASDDELTAALLAEYPVMREIDADIITIER